MNNLIFINNMEDIHTWKAKFDSCEYSNRLLDKLLWINTNKPSSQKINLVEVQKAIYYAKKYHGDQKRQSGEPYYSHPLEVAYMLAEYAAKENKRYFKTDLLVSSILHDTIEDTDLTFEMIAKIFGEVVAQQVEGMTRIKTHGKITSEELVNSLLLQKNKDVLMIKMFDRLHNVQTIQAKSEGKIKKIIDETVKVFLLLSVYLEMPEMTKILIRFCYESLHMKQDIYSLIDTKPTLSSNNFQLPSLKFQSDAVQSNTRPQAAA